MKKPLFIFCMAFTVAVVAANLTGVRIAAVLAAAALIFSAVFVIVKYKNSAAICLCLAFGFIWFAAFNMLFYQPVLNLSSQSVNFNGRIADMPQQFGKIARYIVNVSEVEKDKKSKKVHFKLYVYADPKFVNASVGDFVTFSGKPEMPDSSDNSFDSRAYYRSKGIYLTLYDNGNTFNVTKSHGLRSLMYYAVKVRIYTLNALNSIKSQNGRALSKGILLGDKTEFSAAWKDLFARTGITHAFAVSGMHITFLTGIFAFIFIALGVPRRVSAVITSAAVLFFMAVIGFSPSVTRAGVMSFVMLFGIVFGKKGEVFTSLSFAAAVILLINPYSAADVGFQLSFLSVFGIMTLGVNLRTALRKFLSIPFLPQRIVNAFADSIAATLAAVLFTTPVSAYQFGNFSLCAPLANLAVLWAVEGIFLLSVLFAVIAKIGGLAFLIGFLIDMLSKYTLWMIKLIADIPYAQLYTNYRDALIIILFTAAMGTLYMIFRKNGARITVPILALAFIIIFSSISYRPIGADGDLVFSAVNVGQGDALVLMKGTSAVVVDCGSSNVSNPGGIVASFLRKNGIRRIEAVIMTHPHKDHANGLDDLIEMMPVSTVYLSPHYDTTEYGKAAEMAAIENNTKVINVDSDKSFSALDGVNLYIYNTDDGVSDNLNEYSLVVFADYRDSEIVVTGDIPSSDERKLVNSGRLLDADILKVSHHGSNTSSCNDFLQAVTPEAAVISVGENNYNLPNSEALERIRRYTDRVYSTLQNGTVSFLTNGDGSYQIKWGE
ncbi:MAG: DNA internalization-related competence protein ComEC/Rec2 [Bacillota bacterium]|nr:DNA internalization-related competence protein ComEC/Rec2 [Bacillota bacterium]